MSALSRGTGLIREVVAVAAAKLAPKNPDASVIMSISSMAQRGFEIYVRDFGKGIIIENMGASLKVPLETKGIDSSWLRWICFN